MKKILLIAAVGALAFTSCKKNQTCECTTTDGVTSVSASSTIKDTKKKAKTACENGSSDLGAIKTTCVIK